MKDRITPIATLSPDKASVVEIPAGAVPMKFDANNDVDYSGFLPDQLGFDATNNFKSNSDNNDCLLVVNRTGDTLTVEEEYLAHGYIHGRPAEKDGAVVVDPAPVGKFGNGVSSVGLWQMNDSLMHFAALAIKFKSCPALGNKPVYLFSRPAMVVFERLDPIANCAIHVGECGSAKVYYNAQVRLSSKANQGVPTPNISQWDQSVPGTNCRIKLSRYAPMHGELSPAGWFWYSVTVAIIEA